MRRLGVCALVVALAAGCSVTPARPLVERTAPRPRPALVNTDAPPPVAAPPAAGDCVDPPAGARPATTADRLLAGDRVREIRARESDGGPPGKLVVGVSQTASLLSSRNLRTGELSGLEIDIATRVAAALFPGVGAAELPDHLDYVTVPTKDRFYGLDTAENTRAAQLDPARDVQKVDMIIADATATCAREVQFGARFSTPYLRTAQAILVLGGDPADSRTLVDFRGLRVCAGENTVSLRSIREVGAQPVSVADTTDCMALLQQNQVEAISTDDVILEGFAAQDATTTVLPAGTEGFDYAAIAVSSAHPDLLAVVNAVLEELRGPGMDLLYRKWFGEQTARRMPEPNYAGG